MSQHQQNDYVGLDDFMSPAAPKQPEPMAPNPEVGEGPVTAAAGASPVRAVETAPAVEEVDAPEESATGPVTPVPVQRQAETADALTAERLLPKRQRVPEGGWRLFLYKISGGLINVGDSADVVERHSLEARISARLPRGMRSIVVVSSKGGVGKTTTTALIGKSMAALRHDRTVAMDANPDAGSLILRVERQTPATVWDVVESRDSIDSFSDMSRLVTRDSTRLDVIASENDADRSRAFGATEYNQTTDVLSVYYSALVTDTGTDVTHDVYGAVLARADAVVVVSGSKLDESRLASATLDKIAAMGYEDLARNAVVALVETTGSKVDVATLEQHFASKASTIVRVPFDPHLAEGAVIDVDRLSRKTRRAGLRLAAAVVDQISDPGASHRL